MTEKPNSEKTMDDWAREAQDDLINYDQEHVTTVTDWFEKWYKRAGYRKLAKIILGKY